MALTLNPEQEARIERSVREGRFANADAALDAATRAIEVDDTLSEEEDHRRAQIRSKSLFELMQESPLFDNEIEFERDRSPLRDLDF